MKPLVLSLIVLALGAALALFCAVRLGGESGEAGGVVPALSPALDGGLAKELQVADLDQQSARVAVEADPAAEALHIHQTIPPNTVFGKVVDSRGVPVANGRALQLGGEGMVLKEKELGDDGWYFFHPPMDELPRSVSIRIVADGYVQKDRAALVAETLVHKKFERRRLDFTLERSGELGLNLRFPSGEPVVGATLELDAASPDFLFGSRDQVTGGGTTDDAGEVTVLGLPRHGLFTARVDLPNFRRWWSTPIDLAGGRRELVVPEPHSLRVTLGSDCFTDPAAAAGAPVRKRQTLGGSVLGLSAGRFIRRGEASAGEAVELNGFRLGDSVELVLTLPSGAKCRSQVPIVIEQRIAAVELDCADWSYEEPGRQSRGTWTSARWRFVDQLGRPVTREALGDRALDDLHMFWRHNGERGEADCRPEISSRKSVVSGTVECSGLTEAGLLVVSWAGEERTIPIDHRGTSFDFDIDLAALGRDLVPRSFVGVREDQSTPEVSYLQLHALDDRSIYFVHRWPDTPVDQGLVAQLPHGKYRGLAISSGGERTSFLVHVDADHAGEGMDVQVLFPGHCAVSGRIDSPRPVLEVWLRRSDGSQTGRGPVMRADPDGGFSAPYVQPGQQDVFASVLLDGRKVSLVAARNVPLEAGRVNQIGELKLGPAPSGGSLFRRKDKAEPTLVSIERNGEPAFGGLFQPGDGFYLKGAGEVVLCLRDALSQNVTEETRMSVSGAGCIIEF